MRMLSTFSSIILVFSLLMPISQAAVPVWLWQVVREIAMDIAIDTVQEFFNDVVSRGEVEALQKRLSELEQQLKQKQTTGDYPSQQEFESVQQLVSSLNTLLNRENQRLDNVEQRVTGLENELAQIREVLLSTSVSKAKPHLDFSIRYVYRRGKKGDFKPLTEGSILQSGDYYKIIVTPKQDGYLYIFQLDAANKLYRLFPMQSFKGVHVGHANPVQAGKTYYLPAQSKSFKLDKQVGTETLYLLASTQADVVLENQAQILQLDNSTIDTQLLATVNQKQSKGLASIEDDEDVVESWSESGQNFPCRCNVWRICAMVVCMC